MQKNNSVRSYISNHEQWSDALLMLQEILLCHPFEETIKWGSPVYCIDGKNLVALAAFKNYVGLWFYQGALLKDNNNKLVNAQEGKTIALRQWRFSSFEEVVKEKDTISAYIIESIENHKQGKSIKPVHKPQLELVSEIKEKLESDKVLNQAFKDFSASKQREFCEYISEAKRQLTKQNRLNKIIPMILRGEGLNDKYKK